MLPAHKPKQENQTMNWGRSRATINRDHQDYKAVSHPRRKPNPSPKCKQSQNHKLGLARDTARRGHRERFSCRKRSTPRRAREGKGRFLVGFPCSALALHLRPPRYPPLVFPTTEPPHWPHQLHCARMAVSSSTGTQLRKSSQPSTHTKPSRTPSCAAARSGSQ